MYRLVSINASNLVTISNFSAEEITSILKLDKNKWIVAHCGSDHISDVVPEKPIIDLPEKFVICIGTLASRKNLMPVVSALADAEIHVIVVGASGSKRVFANDSRIVSSPFAHFAGRLTDGEIAWLLCNAQALVFPSLYEGFGLPLVEAQRMGCPVIASDAASMPEVLSDSALYFDPTKPQDAVDHVLRLRLDTVLRSQLIQFGKINSDRFKWEKCAQIIANAIRKTN